MITATTSLVVNGRYRTQPLTGVQRHAVEVFERLPGAVGDGAIMVEEPSRIPAAAGHLWEQAVLPFCSSRKAPLWSPCNFGPVTVRRQLVTVHDVSHFDHPEFFTSSFVRVARLLHQALARAGVRIATVSQFSADRIAHCLGVSEDRIIVTGNGADHLPTPNHAVVDRLGLGEKPFLLAYGSLEPRKNLGRVLDAWQLLGAEITTRANLVVVGAANHLRVHGGSTVDRALPAGVVMSGRLPDDELFGLLDRAASLIFAPLYEGFGLPLVEAWQLNTPMIASDIEPHREIKPNGATWVDPRSIPQIAEAMAAALDRDDAGVIDDRRPPSWSTVADRTLVALEALA